MDSNDYFLIFYISVLFTFSETEYLSSLRFHVGFHRSVRHYYNESFHGFHFVYVHLIVVI